MIAYLIISCVVHNGNYGEYTLKKSLSKKEEVGFRAHEFPRMMTFVEKRGNEMFLKRNDMCSAPEGQSDSYTVGAFLKEGWRLMK